MKPKYFKTPVEFGKWLQKNHSSEKELLVGFYKKDSGKPSITWPESVDEALRHGWIDGIRRRVDDASYTIRFTPRKPRSIWSAVNMGRVQELMKQGRVQAAGMKAFEARTENRSGIYAYEQRKDRLDDPYQGALERNKKAWAFYRAQAASYRRAANWWVVSAKQEATRLTRLGKLVELSAQGKRLPQFIPTKKAK